MSGEISICSVRGKQESSVGIIGWGGKCLRLGSGMIGGFEASPFCICSLPWIILTSKEYHGMTPYEVFMKISCVNCEWYTCYAGIGNGLGFSNNCIL